MAVPLDRLAVPPVYVVTLKDVDERPICEAQVYPEQFSFLQGRWRYMSHNLACYGLLYYVIKLNEGIAIFVYHSNSPVATMKASAHVSVAFLLVPYSHSGNCRFVTYRKRARCIVVFQN
ncbi:uncharacterized protein LOC111245405 [Varroa destructor]|uniref:Uncharacterized protein n=1 Tax=Varroa destructor TaxID=109461 RepID=A0A7M7JB65_VARDE|nr:uncharacterized protein LOC111245405 [Varroa destructor]